MNDKLKNKIKYYFCKGLAIGLIIFIFPIGLLCYIGDSDKERIKNKKRGIKYANF